MYRFIIHHKYFGFSLSFQDRVIYPKLEAYEVGLTAEEIGQLLGGN